MLKFTGIDKDTMKAKFVVRDDMNVAEMCEMYDTMDKANVLLSFKNEHRKEFELLFKVRFGVDYKE